MKKIIRKETGHVIGWTDTTLKRGVQTEFVDRASYTHRGIVAETLKKADRADLERAADRGELF